MALDVVDVAAQPIQVSVIVPTRNESPNVAVLCARLSGALGPAPTWEVLFVDDSDDDTPEVIATMARDEPALRLHHRPRHRRPGGLAGAVQDGFAAAAGTRIVVMDADLQHPPEVVPRLLQLLDGDADLVVGTRYARGGETDGLAGPWRRGVSAGSRRLVHALIPRSRPLSDPLSGLFAFERGVIDGVRLEANGFKILLEVVAKGRWGRAANLPYRFDARHAGVSKASLREGWQFTRHLARLARWDGTPPAPLPRPAPGRDRARTR